MTDGTQISGDDDTWVLTRIFDAPRERVFEAWTSPDYIRRWWGPAGFTCSACSVELRIGGAFHYGMRAPDGREFWNKGVFHEILIPERIVSTMHFSDAQGNFLTPAQAGHDAEFPTEMLDTVTFDAQEDGRTRLVLTRDHALPLAQKFGADAGWRGSLDKFAAALREAA
jgi:uncharacterized protein YndB with AHSA1/START domain